MGGQSRLRAVGKMLWRMRIMMAKNMVRRTEMRKDFEVDRSDVVNYRV